MGCASSAASVATKEPVRLKPPDADWPARSAIDAVAALLSKWVYDAEPQTDEKVASPTPLTLTLGNKPVPLLVHQVFQDPTGETGTPAKVATVTAEVPDVQGPVLFIVFDGASNVLDMLKLDFQRDYDYVLSRAPAGTKVSKPVDFIHRGAAHTMRQLNLFRREALLKCLEDAATKGVQRLVLTGHSLGGMHVQAFLHWAMTEPLESIPRGAAQLLLTARAVTFGSPMVFGTNMGADSPDYFRAFKQQFRSRATNFIHEMDPCPRAWSAVDFKELRIFLGSEDFTKFLSVASQYTHLARVVLLSRNERETFHWKDDFKSAESKIGDHSMAKHLAALLDAKGSGQGKCFYYLDDTGSRQSHY